MPWKRRPMATEKKGFQGLAVPHCLFSPVKRKQESITSAVAMSATCQ